MFFFEKKNQKTFDTWFGVSLEAAACSETNYQKFFVSFFQKRNT
jgi:hypothetical protein